MNFETNAADSNLVKMIGTISKPPRVFNEDPDKMPFMTLSIETKEKGIIDGEGRSSWHQVKGFGKQLVRQADQMCEGARIGFFGRLATRSYEVGGETKYITEIIIDPGNFTILKTVTKADLPDPMDGYDAAAGDAANAEARIDKEVDAENALGDHSDDDIPF